MSILNKLDTKISGATSKAGNVLNLTDNIVGNDTVIGDFLDMGEGNDFLSGALSGIKDFLHKIGEAYGFLKNLINKVLAFINEVLSYLDLNKLFDALGLTSIMNTILDVIGFTLFNGVLGDREDFFNLLQKGCININRDGINNPLLSYILSGVIMGLGCGGEQHAFTLLDLTLKEEDETKFKEEEAGLLNELANLPLIEALTVTATDGTVTTTQPDADLVAHVGMLRDDFTQQLVTLRAAHEEKMDEHDTIIHNTIHIAFKHSKTEGIENLLLDMETVPAFTKSKFLANTQPILGFIDRIDLTTINELTYAKLIALLNKFDESLIDRKSFTLAYLARINMSRKQMSLSPSAITSDFRTLIKPSYGEYKPC